MGFDFEEKKTLQYADLFKGQETHDNANLIMSRWRSPSSTNSSATDSSSSGFTTPFGSELGSSESENGDFAAELSRQMAECMLHEEDETNSVTHSAPFHTFKYGLNSNVPVLDHANRTPCIVLKNHSPFGVSRSRRISEAELTHQMQTQGRCRGGDSRNGRKGQTGSGMRAVFLGAGSRNGPSGTGVFLPRVTNNPAEQKQKSGLSTVLIPTRVLEALELHFSTLSATSTPPLTTNKSSHQASPGDEGMGSERKRNIYTKMEMEKVDEMQILPQEWTY